MDRTFVYYRIAGLFFAFLLAAGAIAGGIWLASEDHSTAGVALIIADLVALVAVFVAVQRRRSKWRELGFDKTLTSGHRPSVLQKRKPRICGAFVYRAARI
jgi:drug/metabolite transporter (DMT)-like permease